MHAQPGHQHPPGAAITPHNRLAYSSPTSWPCAITTPLLHHPGQLQGQFSCTLTCACLIWANNPPSPLSPINFPWGSSTPPHHLSIPIDLSLCLQLTGRFLHAQSGYHHHLGCPPSLLLTHVGIPSIHGWGTIKNPVCLGCSTPIRLLLTSVDFLFTHG